MTRPRVPCVTVSWWNVAYKILLVSVTTIFAVVRPSLRLHRFKPYVTVPLIQPLGGTSRSRSDVGGIISERIMIQQQLSGTWRSRNILPAGYTVTVAVSRFSAALARLRPRSRQQVESVTRQLRGSGRTRRPIRPGITHTYNSLLETISQDSHDNTQCLSPGCSLLGLFLSRYPC